MEAHPTIKLLLIGPAPDDDAELSRLLERAPRLGLLFEQHASLKLPDYVHSAAFEALVLLADPGRDEARSLVESAQTAHPGIPVLVLLDSANDVFAAAALEAGALDCLPIAGLEPSTLQRVVGAAIQRAGEREHLKAVDGELETLRRELQDLQEFQRNVAIFAHEINSPLTGLLGFLQLIVEEVEEQEEDEDRAAMLRDSLEAATRIRRVMMKLHQITEPVYKRSRYGPRSLQELSQHGESIA